ncbi:MAG: type VI-A CRISPR-associated RNA-guided ribonuclease Cas13a [Bdellovibrionales bacterium]|nr:type VI-A CRISPR-associated RNA-guided ribonuclease Cas13a [Bdellovibrionales bacterium]
MKIVRPYGQSTVGSETTPRKRQLLRYPSEATSKSETKRIPEFAEAHADLLIAQWISVIDKIVRKPKKSKANANGLPTKIQYQVRKDLGNACWEILKTKLGEKPDQFEKIWAWKLHPYGMCPPYFYPEPDKAPRIEGRWCKTFLGKTKADDIDYSKLAKDIENHLHCSERIISGVSREHRPNKKDGSQPRGLIAARAHGIEKSVLKPIEKLADHAWKECDEMAFLKSDLAKEIYELANPRDKRRKINPAEVGRLIFEHYAKQFGDGNGKVLPRSEIRKRQPGLLHLYDATRAHYKTLLRTSKRENVNRALPRNGRELLGLLKHRHVNRSMNALIRLGRIIHYGATPVGDDNMAITGASEIWKADMLSNSHYWTSAGQAEIKRSEAFVRVWRNTMSQASRTLKSWADPHETWEDDKNRPADVLDDEASKTALGKCDCQYVERAKEHSKLLFGKRAGVFDDCVDYTRFLYLVLRLAAKCRNEVFHFRGRADFVRKLQNKLANGDFEKTFISQNIVSEVFCRARTLLEEDFAESGARFLATCQGAKINEFAKQTEMDAYLKLFSDDDADIGLPKFNRLLLRLENIEAQTVCEGQTLPKPAKADELESPALLAKYTACKLLYEGPFRLWLEKRETAKINCSIACAVKAGTERAKKEFKNDLYRDLIQAHSEKIGRLAEGQTIASLFDRLTRETAAEMRVQNAYESSPENAREQAAWIDAFRCDVVGEEFKKYLLGRRVGWLLELREESQPQAQPAELETANSATWKDPPQWLANLYLVLHMVPVDDVARLLHQFRKWGVLESKGGGKDDDSVAQMRKVLLLYLRMHDAKFEGDGVNLDLKPFKELYECTSDFDRLYPKAEPGSDRLAGTRRGLREIMRFGHPNLIKALRESGEHIAHANVEKVLELETVKGTSSKIAVLQKCRKELHKKAVRNAETFSKDDLQHYRQTLAEIEEHRRLAANVRLTNQVKLHRLMMRCIARLIDFAGLWERDLYFVTLAMIKLNELKLEDIFSEKGGGLGEFQKLGEVRIDGLKSDFKSKLPWYGQIEKGHHWQIRNDLTHFNILNSKSAPLCLTHQINRTRELLSYDRKLKNAVTKSIKELMFEEGFILEWKMSSEHKLHLPKVSSRSIQHLPKATKRLECREIQESLHDAGFVAQVAKLFCP